MLILAVAMLLNANPAEGPTSPKVAFKTCIKRLDIDDLISDGAGMTKCLREYSAATPKDDLQNVDPIAKQVADEEAEKYSIVLTSTTSDRAALCVQAALTAQAYLDAKMPRAYDSWKATERNDCAAGDRVSRTRN
jgi:hypothetical protein